MFRLPVEDLIPLWRLVSRATIAKAAHYNELPLPAANLPVMEQLLDLVESSKLSSSELFVVAAERGETDILSRLLSRVDNEDDALVAAARAGQLGSVKFLLGSEDIDPVVDYAMAVAANGGHSEVVDLFIAYGNSNYGAALDYNVALESAAAGGQLAIVEKMLALGARDHYGMALYLAAREGHLEVVRRLLDAGTPRMPLLATALKGCNEEVVELLLSRGVISR